MSEHHSKGEMGNYACRPI